MVVEANTRLLFLFMKMFTFCIYTSIFFFPQTKAVYCIFYSSDFIRICTQMFYGYLIFFQCHFNPVEAECGCWSGFWKHQLSHVAPAHQDHPKPNVWGDNFYKLWSSRWSPKQLPSSPKSTTPTFPLIANFYLYAMRGNNENQMRRRRKAEAGLLVMNAVEEDACL